MNICSSCGTQLEVGARFCNACGAHITWAPIAVQPKKQQFGTAFGVVIIGVLILIIGSVFEQISRHDPPPARSASNESIQPESFYQLCGPPIEDVKSSTKSYEMRGMRYQKEGVVLIFASPFSKDKSGKRTYDDGNWKLIKVLESPSGSELDHAAALQRMSCLTKLW